MSPVDAMWESERLRSAIARRDAQVREIISTCPNLTLDQIEQIFRYRYQLRQEADRLDQIARGPRATSIQFVRQR